MKHADEMTDDELARAVIAALKTSAKSQGASVQELCYFVEQYSGVRMSPNQLETAASYLEHCVAQDIVLRTHPRSLSDTD